MAPPEKQNRMEAIIHQTKKLIDLSDNSEMELSEEQMDLIVAGVSAPEYQQFLQNTWKERRRGYGATTNR